MNPKKKIFEAIQPQLTTLDTLEACFIDKETGEVSKIRTKNGYCTVKKFVGASLS
jgi:aminoacyl tRNA synthase complex-interacting multifunctional protein 1